MTPQAALDVFRRALTRAKTDPTLARDEAEVAIVASLIDDLPSDASDDGARFARFLDIVVEEYHAAEGGQ